MLPRLSCAVAALLATVSCTPGVPEPPPAAPTPVPGAPPPVAPAPADAVIRFGPSTLRYVIHQQIHVEQEFQGQTSTVDRGLRAWVYAAIAGPADSLGYPLALTIDSVIADSGTVLPPTLALSAIRGLVLRGRLTPTGEFRDAEPSDTTLGRTFAQLIGTFQTFYPRLPPGGLTLGAEWTDTVTTTDRTLIEVTSTAISHSRATAWEPRLGIRALRLEVTSTYTVAGSGEQGGQPMELSGSGERSSVQFIAADGRYLGGEARDSAAISVNLPVQSTTVPVRQVSRSTVTVLH